MTKVLLKQIIIKFQ